MPTRRKFLQTGASASVAALLAPSFSKVAQATEPTTEPFQQLDYSEVQLLDSPLRTQFDHNNALFLSLDNDRLLKPFRQLAGLPAPGEDMGGWYSPSPDFDPPKNMSGFVPGHTFGQYLSGLARAYAQTGDKATQQKVHTLVTEYAAAISPKFYANYTLPCYTFDKVNCGLIDAHAFAGSPNAFDALNRTTDAALPYFPEKALTRPEMRARPYKVIAQTWDESYTLPENFYLAYKRGAGARYRTLAQRYLQDKDYFDPLAAGENPAIHDHAYSHVNALSSAMQAYLTDGSQKHFIAARNGFHLLQQQSFATGGWGPNETIVDPKTNELADSLTHTHAGFETPCGAYGHFKIARYLLRTTGESAYGDSMETVLYNTILGARLIQPSGISFYYSDYNNNAVKSDYEQKWPCCSGTFPQLTADYGISSYFRTARGLAVNLYQPSLVSWKQGSANATLSQRTTYPHSSEVAFVLALDRKQAFMLQFRIPSWAGPHTRVAINGKALPETPLPGTWFPINRTWTHDDNIELTLDMPLRLLPLDPKHPDLVALAHGPVVLFAVLPAPDRFDRQQLLTAQRTSSSSTDWLVTTSAGPITMRPFASITTERYRLYQQL
jgi:uncharacterized protein